jgi:DNA (cytosine-5)-methyltransferase 1
MSSIVSRRRPRVGVSAPKAISLFSGAGGDTLGLKRAGYDVIAFSEFKKPAIATHLAEFPNSVLLNHPESGLNDITQIPDSVFLKYVDQVDLVFSGFPCQGFSNAGKKKVDDPRNELVNEFARVVRLVRPKWIIGENVSGLLSRTGKDPYTGKIRPVIKIIQDIFSRIGYNITYKVLKATEFGVPQERKRLIIVGCKADQGFPHMSWESLKSPTYPKYNSIRPFLERHLNDAMEFDEKNIPEDLSDHYWIETDEKDVSGKPHPNLVRLVHSIRNKSSKEKKESDDTSSIIVEGGLISFGVRKSSYHGQVLDPDLPSKTIICTYGVCPRLFVGLYNPRIKKYWIRCLSIKELGQIQGFPMEYKWQGKEKEIITQIGNAVPPSLCESVVSSLSDVTFHLSSQVDSLESSNDNDEKEESAESEEEDE